MIQKRFLYFLIFGTCFFNSYFSICCPCPSMLMNISVITWVLSFFGVCVNKPIVQLLIIGTIVSVIFYLYKRIKQTHGKMSFFYILMVSALIMNSNIIINLYNHFLSKKLHYTIPIHNKRIQNIVKLISLLSNLFFLYTMIKHYRLNGKRKCTVTEK